MIRILLAASLLCLSGSAVLGVDNGRPPGTKHQPVAELGLMDTIVLGAVEGVTEYLPISSTGHLIIATRVLGLDSTEPLTDSDGRTLWHRPPSPGKPDGEPLTLKLAADTFNIVMQVGAIAAVALLYWPQCLSLMRGALGRDPAGRRLLINLVIAFLPAATTGLLLHEWIDAHLFSVGYVIAALVVGAGLMFFADAWWRRAAATGKRRQLDELSPAAAAGIGLMQCLALWPGMSRSMTTIVGGYFAGLEPRRAAEFSFLLGLITLTAASAFKACKSGTAMFQVFGVPHVVLGAGVAALTAGLCVRLLVRWLTRHGLGVFAWYRLVLAAALTITFYL